jgi:formylglycine-generating enzyme required for sulfatase activity
LAAVAFLFVTQANPNEPVKAPTPSADPMRGKVPGEIRDDNDLKMNLVWCPPGFFTMETLEYKVEPAVEKDNEPNADDVDPQEAPAHKPRQTTTPVKVFMTKGYWLSKYEVTQSEWKQVMKTEPWKGKSSTREGADFPATYVDWNDSTKFCSTLTEQEREAGRLPDGWEYTLPTEAQWERACRARTETRFSFGSDDSLIGEYAWFIGNTVSAGEDYPHRVGQKKPNPWGLHDMHGNVWEWCRDSYDDKLPGGRDPEVTDRGSNRVLRGGGIYRSAPDCRSAYRNKHTPDWRLFDLGFRVALSLSRIK